MMSRPARSAGWLVLGCLLSLATGGVVLAVAEPSGSPVAAASPGQAGPTAASDADADGLSDSFEQAGGVTSPTAADTDGDGLLDAAEDPDGDGLGNLAEQRYQTHPGMPDSDADGVSDGDEDSDDDGLSDAAQQDRRRVPTGLRPSLAGAWWDRPSNYDDRCHADAVDAELHPCTFGVSDGDLHIVLFGDSHALQWLPPLVAAAEQEGWTVTTLTKAACPPAQVEFGRKEPGAAASCLAWREAALGWLDDQPPDLLLMTGAGRAYKVLGQDGERLPEDEALAAWQRGSAATLEAVPPVTRVVVLADTPLMRRNPVSCLEADPSDMSACVTPRSEALDPALDAAERETVEAAGAAYESLGDLVCPYDPCPVVIGDVLIWRNADHITATFAAQLAPAMQALVTRHAGARHDVGSPAPSASGVPPSGG
jgi:hypothetical protein